MKIEPYDFDDDLIDLVRKDRMPRVRVYRPRETQVVLGRGSKPDLELNQGACVQDGIPVLKRRGGGCAVVLDPGNVIVSVVLPLGGMKDNRRLFKKITGWLIAGLEEAGLQGIRPEGVSDLAIGELKVGGACLYRSKEILFYSSTLLVQPDLIPIERYLKHPPREPEYRRGRRHRDFMTKLAPEYWDKGMEDLVDALRGTLRPGAALLAASFGLRDSGPTDRS